jgi:hypothetical protein
VGDRQDSTLSARVICFCSGPCGLTKYFMVVVVLILALRAGDEERVRVYLTVNLVRTFPVDNATSYLLRDST